MKKLVAFALVLSLGLFFAVGCTKEVKKVTPPKQNPPVTTPVTPEKKPGEAATTPEPAKTPATPEKK
jgi:hypothetical protein